MSLGMKEGWEPIVNRAFAFIIKNVPNYTWAQNEYKKLKSKDLSHTVCHSDMMIKIGVVKEYRRFTGIDLLGRQGRKRVRESIVIHKLK